MVCRRLIIPAQYLPTVHGALHELTQEYNWEQFGTDTPAQAAEKMLDMLDDWEGDCMPIGSIIGAVTSSAPTGYLACDGTQYLRVDYPDLYAALDSTFIDDADHFTVPDFEGRAVIGAGTGSGLTARALGDTGGVETHTLTASEMPSHTHTYLPPTINPDIEGPGVPDVGATVLGTVTNTGSAGGDGAHENMPPFGVVTWYIKAVK